MRLIKGRWKQCARVAGHRGKHQALDFIVTAEWAQSRSAQHKCVAQK